MRNSPLLALLIAFLAACGASDSEAQSMQDRSSATLREFDAYLDKTAAQLGGSPFAAVVSTDGKVIYERYDDAQGVLGKPVDEHSRWQVFSITKSFVSALVLSLCADEVLSLDDPVGKYLPAFSEDSVSIRHLMSHTSGVAIDGDKTPASLPSSLDDIEIITVPGTVFEYSGLGMLVLERTLEAATGKDLEVLLNERIIEPLGLDSTGYVYDGATTNELLPLSKDQYTYSENGKRAGSGLYTTARDLNRFGQFWLDPESEFSVELRQEAWTYHGTRASDGGPYGLLWWLFESDGGYVMSGRQSKINAIIPETNTVITVIRYPQARSDRTYKFAEDKRAMVLFGRHL